jgi:hypothetical protein
MADGTGGIRTTGFSGTPMSPLAGVLTNRARLD